MVMGRVHAMALILAALVVSSWLAGPMAAADVAQVRVIHASPDTPPVDVYVDGGKALSALGFTKASDYLPLAPGRHDFALFPAGTTPTSGEPVIQAKGVEIVAGAKLSIVGIGWLASIRALVVDDRTPVPAPGKAKLRFVHVGPDVQAIDVAARGGAVLFGGAQFGNAYPYREVDIGAAEIEIRPAGATAAVIAVGIAPEAGRVYSAYLMSLGATRVLLDTTASDATAAPEPVKAAATPASAVSPDAAPNPLLGTTGRAMPRGASDPTATLVALAGALAVGGGVMLRRARRS